MPRRWRWMVAAAAAATTVADGEEVDGTIEVLGQQL